VLYTGAIFPRNIPKEYSQGILGGNIQREYGEGIFPGNISGEYKIYNTLGIYTRNISRVYTLGI